MSNLRDETLLIIAAHPDDEVLGCGGLISKVKEGSGKVFVLFLTNGTTADFSGKGISTQAEREEEIKSVSEFLRLDGYRIAFAGNKFHLRLDEAVSQKDLMDEIERGQISLESTTPTIVAFPSLDDYNQDHKAVAVAAFASCRPAPAVTKKVPAVVLSYEHPTGGWGLSTGMYPNFFVPLSQKNLKDKLHALKLYKSQVRKNPHPRSLEVVESLARVRGSLCGTDYAEGYSLHRGNL